jgi:hypothetical protein
MKAKAPTSDGFFLLNAKANTAFCFHNFLESTLKAFAEYECPIEEPLLVVS